MNTMRDEGLRMNEDASMRDVATTELARWDENNQAYLAASLQWLRLRLRQMAEEAVQAPPASGPHAAGNGISWFSRRESGTAAAPRPALPAPVRNDAVDEAAAARARAAQAEPPPALLMLGERLGLGPFETDILLLCTAVELDPSVPSLIGAAQAGLGSPTFALALRALEHAAWDALAPQNPLRRLGLIEINQPGATPLTAAALRADERVVNFVKGLNLIDERVAALAKPKDALPPLADTQLRRAEETIATLRAVSEGGDIPLVQLLGADRGSRTAVAAHVAAGFGRNLLVLQVESLPASRGEIEQLSRLWQRESLLLPVALYLEADQIDPGTGQNAALQQFLEQPLGLVFLGLRATPLKTEASTAIVEIDLPTPREQQQAWMEVLPEAQRERQAELLTGHFRLNLKQIREAAAAAQAQDGDTWRVCRDFSLPRLDVLAQRLSPKARWDDLVLSEEATGLLRQIAGQVHERHRVYHDWGYAERMNRGMGISALFAGESGTGKTMAAEVIANDLRMHLFRIDLSSVISKYVGETEKNLRQLFDAAEQGGAILLFDEADALFGKRSEVKDSHDRYANIEINYLLQRMEAFSGLAILATNMKSSLDIAFMRRLRFVVNFQFPGPNERALIWRNAFAAGVPRRDLDYTRLARFSLSGGNIHSIALNASFAAAANGGEVTMPLLLAAVRSELRKLDKPINEAEFR